VRPKHCFTSEACFGEFILEKRRGPIKTFLFPGCCIDILSCHGEIDHAVLTTVDRASKSSRDRIAEFDGAAYAAKNAKAPRSIFVGSSIVELDA
jgi:hypothetical protein